MIYTHMMNRPAIAVRSPLDRLALARAAEAAGGQVRIPRHGRLMTTLNKNRFAGTTEARPDNTGQSTIATGPMQ
jgi:hypothetical protein